MEIECGTCRRKLKDVERHADGLQATKCKGCGAEGAWHQAPSTEETCASDLAGVVDRAVKSGVDPKSIRKTLNALLKGLGS